MENGNAILEAILTLREATEMGFARVEARFDGVDARFEGIDARFERVESRLGALETRLGHFEAKVYERFDRVLLASRILIAHYLR